ncbi:hypothetical protein BDP27DRAFT_1406801 [Rhodocollybia butyracea]|uniref:Uncharacterized protein n=1 Tax=Rhodocollybia butyracea TaxID=206335 RepID=A0A9P5TZ53_9AGAR|nr:hypothetical protein BDP27DRAFT_1406801 [Rhodocollybia butyracea]
MRMLHVYPTQEYILSSGSEWSTRNKLIVFSSRPGPKGYELVIESERNGIGIGKGKAGYRMGDEKDVLGMEKTGEKSGGEFSRYFTSEIIGKIQDEPRRRPRKILGGMKDKEWVGG